MAEEVRLWEVRADDQLVEISRAKLNLEERIEKWLVKDINLLGTDLLVIGEQVETAYGKLIDLLCIDRSGNLVIVELKRDLTPREVVAQTLDYASWVKDLEADQIEDIASTFFGSEKALAKEFIKKFNETLPSVINENHSMRIVASEIDDSTTRIIRYLSETYSVDINAATFRFYKGADGREYLSRSYTLDPTELEASVAKKSGKRIAWDWESFKNDSIKRGLSEQDVAVIRKALDLCKSLSLEVQWGKGRQYGSINIVDPIYSKLLLSIYSDGRFWFNLGNYKKSPEEVEFQDNFRKTCIDMMGLPRPEHDQKPYPNYPIADWIRRGNELEGILRSLVKDKKSAFAKI